MTFMELIRRKGAWFLAAFLLVFLVTLFYGLTTGGNFGTSPQGGPGPDEPNGLGAGAAAAGLLVSDGDWAGTALKVNGRKVGIDQFNETYARILASSRMPGSTAEIALDAYNYTAQYLGEQELILAKAEELQVEVTAADLAGARQEAATSYIRSDAAKKGNVVSDVFSGLEKRKAEKAAFGAFLQANGMTEAQWEREARRNLLVENTREKIQKEADDKLKTEMESRKAEIDTKLGAGEDFAELAKQYSDDDRKAEGGEMGWIGAGLLQKDTEFYEAQRAALFDTPVGEVSAWVDIPAGFVRYQVYDRKKAEGADFEAKKAELTEQIKGEHASDPDYTPTEEEIAERYEQVAARQIMLRTSAPDAFGEAVNELRDAAHFEYNVIYVLAHQALSEPKLQPPSSVDADQLETIAKKAAVGDGYDFQLIRDKLQAGEPSSKPGLVTPQSTDDDGAEDAAGEDADSEQPADAAPLEAEEAADAAAEAAAPTDAEETAAERVDIPQVGEDAEAGAPATPQVFNLAETPIYALAIGLLEVAAQNEGATSTALPHYLIARQYSDWLDDEEMLKLQPIDRQKARDAIERELALVVEKDNYNAEAYALRGLNLAWLDRKDEAYAQLDLAMKYAPQEEGPTWDMVLDAYEVFDDQAKIDTINDKLTEFRQAALQKMLEQAQAQQSAAPPVPAPVEETPETPAETGNSAENSEATGAGEGAGQ